jgi:hypothetical protein
VLREPRRTNERVRSHLRCERITLLHDGVRLPTIGTDLLRASDIDAR